MLRRLVLLSIFIISSSILYGADQYYCLKENERYNRELEQFSEQFQSALNDAVVHRLNAIEDLKAFMLANNRVPSEEAFIRYAAQSLQQYPTISYMEYSDEENIVRYYYPISEGEGIIGRDVNTRRFYATATTKAIRDKITTVNPVPTERRDKKYITPRSPLYIGDEFVGVVWTGFEFPIVLEEVLNNVIGPSVQEDRRYHVAISGPGYDMFWQHNQLANGSDTKMISVKVADVQWNIQFGWNEIPQPATYVRGLILGIGGIATVLLLAVFNGMLSRQEWLANAVVEKTAALEEQNASLEEEIAERFRAEDELRLSESRLKAFLTAIPDLMLHISRDGMIMDVRARNDSLIYASPSEFQYKNVCEVLPPEVASSFMSSIEKTFTTSEIQTLEYCRPINGTLRYMEARSVVSAPDQVGVIVRDITEKKQHEDCDVLLQQISIRVLEEEPIDQIIDYICNRLVEILSLSKIAVGLKQADGTITLKGGGFHGQCANEAAGRWDELSDQTSAIGIVIRTGKSVIGQTKADLRPWQIQTANRLNLDLSQLNSYATFPLTVKGTTIGGLSLGSSHEYFWNENLVFQLENFARQMAIAISAAENRQRLKLLNAGLEAAANTIIITDREGNIEWVNPAFTKITGYGISEVLGQNVEILRSSQSDDLIIQRQWETIQAGNVWHGVMVNRRKDGSLYPEEMTITPVKNEHGEIANFIAVKQDITERQKALEAILAAKEVRARAEKLFSIGTLAAGISHEINQPLNSIKMIASGIVYAHKQGKKRDVGEVAANIEEISKQADRINSIVSHLRSFVRKEGVQVEPCNLNTAIEQSLAVVGEQLAAHGIIVRRELATDIPPVLATFTAMEEIIINLMVNAMQALDTVDRREKEIRLHTYVEDGVLLAITDNGPGISAEIGQKVYEPFFSTKKEIDNLGLGLAIVHSLVTSYGGMVCYESVEGTGTTFVVKFPLANG